MSNLYYCEILKIRKSPIRFLIVIAGMVPVFFTVFPQFMAQTSGDWDYIILGNLSFFNLLIGIPLFYLITGYTFAYEYKNNTISQLFCYPRSKNDILIAKFLVVITCIAITAAISFLGLLFSGLIWNSSDFEIQTLLKRLDLFILSIFLQVFLIPCAICLSIFKRSVLLPVGASVLLVIIAGFTIGTRISDVFLWAIPIRVILHLGNHTTMNNIMFYISIGILILFFIITSLYSLKLYNKDE